MKTITQLNVRRIKLLKLNIALKYYFAIILLLDKTDSKFQVVVANMNFVTSLLKFVERWTTHLSR